MPSVNPDHDLSFEQMMATTELRDASGNLVHAAPLSPIVDVSNLPPEDEAWFDAFDDPDAEIVLVDEGHAGGGGWDTTDGSLEGEQPSFVDDFKR